MTRTPSTSPAARAAESATPATPRRRGRRKRAIHMTGRIEVPAEIQAWERELLLPLVVHILDDLRSGGRHG